MQHTAVGASYPLRPQGGAHGRTSRPGHIAFASALTRSTSLRLRGYIRVAIETAPRLLRLFQLPLPRPRRRSGCFMAGTTCARARRPAKHTSRRPRLSLLTCKEGTVSLSASRRGQGRATRTAHDIRACHAPGAPPLANHERRSGSFVGDQPRASGDGQVGAAVTRLGTPSPAPGSATDAPARTTAPPPAVREGGRGGRLVAVISGWPQGAAVRARPGGPSILGSTSCGAQEKPASMNEDAALAPALRRLVMQGR